MEVGGICGKAVICGCDSRSKHQLIYAERDIGTFCNAHENRNKLMNKIKNEEENDDDDNNANLFGSKLLIAMEKQRKMATANNN